MSLPVPSGGTLDLKLDINKAYAPALTAEERWLILYGGAGSGKSYFAAQKKLIRTLQEPGHRFLVCRKVGVTLRQSTFALFRELIGDLGLGPVARINKTDMEIGFVNGSTILHAGLDDVEKLKSVHRITGIWVEEATEVTPADLRQLNLRLRGETQHYKQIILSFNPVSDDSHLKTRFFDTIPENARVIKTTYRDNAFLDKEYKEELEGLADQDFYSYRVYTLGEWASLGNIIYSNWEVADIPTDPHDYSVYVQGLDFGFNNPSAFVKVGVKDEELYIFEEFRESKLTNSELGDRLEGLDAKGKLITADSAEPARIAELEGRGFKIIGATKEKDSVKAGIDWLKSRKIWVHPSCVGMIAELRGYKYREDREGRVFDEPVARDDHLLDALRYSIEPLRRFTPLPKVSLGRMNEGLRRVSPNLQ